MLRTLIVLQGAKNNPDILSHSQIMFNKANDHDDFIQNQVAEIDCPQQAFHGFHGEDRII